LNFWLSSFGGRMGNSVRVYALLLTIFTDAQVTEQLPRKAPGLAVTPGNHYPLLVRHEHAFLLFLSLGDRGECHFILL
jgi:hypothetical protein